MAAWDLWGQMKKMPIHDLWDSKWNETTPTPICDYTLGIDPIEKMVQKMKDHPWPIYKVKVGTDYDIEMITALRQHTDKPLRVDANAGWTTEEALVKIPALAQLGVEFSGTAISKRELGRNGAVKKTVQSCHYLQMRVVYLNQK
jgi:L-alanine-DL-glutamate epimerase-like enolase superfamily enzyme